MTPYELSRILAHAADAVEEYMDSASPAQPSVSLKSELDQAAVRLSEGLYLLLPARGKSTSLNCPHCGKSIKVSLTK